MSKGICYGISVGPGANDLITLQAISIIESCQVIFLPSFPKEDCKAYQIIKEIIPEIDNWDIRAETFTMSKNASVKEKRHDEIFENAKALLDEGSSIAFLTLGEVSLYSTYLYIHERLLKSNYESVLVPGISSVQAISARLSRPLALGDEELHIFPNSQNLEHKLNYNGTKVFMKSRLDLADTITRIREYAKKNPDADIYGISNCGMPGEIIAESADELPNLNGYFTVIFVKKDNHDIDPCANFYENRACKYYPCHKGIEHLNCMFCFCPMYNYENCLGNPTYKEIGGKNIKVCTNCTFPHVKNHYETMMDFLKNQ